MKLTIRAQIEELVKEIPSANAYDLLYWFKGYFQNSPGTVDAGVFLEHFLNAVEEGVVKWV